MKKNFIEITPRGLSLNFESVGNGEKLNINFHRTLRIPDDNKKYGLPPSIGHFPLEHVEDFANNLPAAWSDHGGIFFPMYQAEAMWMSFGTQSGRPYAIKVASGKVNAVSGKEWKNELIGQSAERRPVGEKTEPDYMVAPKQPWLDGFNVGKGVIRQFVAVPLESGYTVEEQVTGKAEVGGIQIIAYPMKEEVWAKILKKREEEYLRISDKYKCDGGVSEILGGSSYEGAVYATASASSASPLRSRSISAAKPDMGLGAGGMMTQEIFKDEYGLDVWDQAQGLRVFVHLANSEQYKSVTGKNPPTEAPTPKLYSQYGYTWFQYYSDGDVLDGSEVLSKVDSIASMQAKNNEKILPDDGHKPSVNQPLVAIGKKTVKGGSW